MRLLNRRILLEIYCTFFFLDQLHKERSHYFPNCTSGREISFENFATKSSPCLGQQFSFNKRVIQIHLLL
ncbi:hypothetical protein C0J52_13051 [Blattella germanica]|nr:hypothetical protein C0J52_13051 [Blattella germanica]